MPVIDGFWPINTNIACQIIQGCLAAEVRAREEHLPREKEKYSDCKEAILLLQMERRCSQLSVDIQDFFISLNYEFSSNNYAKILDMALRYGACEMRIGHCECICLIGR